MTYDIRDPLTEEIDAIARLWHSGWHDAHAALVPKELFDHRTLDSFRQRTAKHLSATRVVGPINGPIGMCMVHDDELYQMYVSDSARGTGVAAALMADCEARFIAQNIPLVWLSCAIGNDRAARFYKKCGWTNSGIETYLLETTSGQFPMDVWRFEKHLVRGGSGQE